MSIKTRKNVIKPDSRCSIHHCRFFNSAADGHGSDRWQGTLSVFMHGE